MEGSQGKQEVLLKIKKRFVFNVCRDVALVLSWGLLIVFLPLTLAFIFIPDTIIHDGYFLAWFYIIIIIYLTFLGFVFIYFLYDWILSRWKSSRKQVEAEVKK